MQSGVGVKTILSSVPTLPSLVWLLVGLRWRSMRGSLRAGPRVAAARWGALFALLVPAGYAGLFATALGVLEDSSSLPVGALFLAAILGLLAAGSLLAKLGAGDLVRGQGGEIELLLTHPVSLASLVVARALSGALTDLLGALFLLPPLAAAAWKWNFGGAGLLVAVMTSVMIQIAVTGVAQTGQVVMVQLLAPRVRRLCFVVCTLASAASIAIVWMLGSRALRDPHAFAEALLRYADTIAASPGRFIATPLLRLGTGQGALASLLLLGLGAAAVVATAGLVARWASRRGWEQAGLDTGWSKPAALAKSATRVTLAGKDWRLLVRDRSRLMSLLALPLLFVGVQVFGSAGWRWTSASPTRIAICAYSLAAYAATFGPLIHLEAERRAFWILRAVPVSLPRLFMAKAGFWSVLLSGFALTVYVALVGFSSLPRALPLRALIEPGVFVAVGTTVAVWLAVGLGAAHADLSDDARPAVGLGTAYLFMLASGLFNLVLVAPNGSAPAFGMFVLAAMVAFLVGAEHARRAFDAEELRRRRLSAVLGVVCATFLLLGGRAVGVLTSVADAGAVADFARGWTVLVGGIALAHWLRQRAGLAGWLSLAVAVAIVVGAFVAPSPGGDRWISVLVVELLARGLVQAGLREDLGANPSGAAGRSRWFTALPLVVSVAVAALLDAGGSLPLEAVAVDGARAVNRSGGLAGGAAAALLPALAFSRAPRAGLAVAIVVRLVVELIRLSQAWHAVA